MILCLTGAEPPATTALATDASTALRLSTEMATSASVPARASPTGLSVRVEKRDSGSSPTPAYSLMIRLAAFSSLDLGLNEKPSAAKKSTLRSRSFTGR